MKAINNIDEVLGIYSKIRSVHPASVFSFVSFSSDGSVIKRVLWNEAKFKTFTVERLRDLLLSMGSGESATISIFPSKFHKELEQLVFVKDGGQDVEGDLRSKLASSLDNYERHREESKIRDSATYEELLEFFQREFATKEREKRLQNLEQENAELRLKLKEQEEQEREMERLSKQADRAEIFKHIGTQVFSRVILNNKEAIAKTVQSLAGIPAEAVKGILSGDSEELNNSPTTIGGGFSGIEDPFLAFYQQLSMEDRQAIAEYADSYIKGKRAENLQSEKQVITIN